MFPCAAQSQGRFKPRCASSAVPFPPPKAQHPHHHSGETQISARSWPEVVSLGVSVDGERGMGLLTCRRYGCSWPSCSLHPKGDKHGGAGTNSGITLRPGVLLHRSREDIFVRAAVLVGPLLDEPEEFCATSLKTLLLLLKCSGLGTLLPTSPSSPDTPAGATLAREREQPSLSSLQQGKSDSPPSLQGHCQNGVLCWRKSPPCLDFLIRSGPAQSPVSPSAWAGKMSLMAGASHRGQNRMLGACGDPEGAALRAPHCV